MKNTIYSAKHFGSHNANVLCPCCRVNTIGEYPAISRGGNNWLICSECGMNESLLIFGLTSGKLSLEEVYKKYNFAKI